MPKKWYQSKTLLSFLAGATGVLLGASIPPAKATIVDVFGEDSQVSRIVNIWSEPLMDAATWLKNLGLGGVPFGYMLGGHVYTPKGWAGPTKGKDRSSEVDGSATAEAGQQSNTSSFIFFPENFPDDSEDQPREVHNREFLI